VGVVAVDPSSSLSGGAILGDRVRMQRHFEDVGVFIRSVATRGAVGGLSSSTQDIARIMDAMGFDIVLIETVGVGQDEVEIASVADTVAVVLSPDTGDAVQIMKAGIMEVGDVFVVNKADRPGADMVARELSLFFQLHHIVSAPEVVETVAVRQEGLEKLARALAKHREGSTRTDKRARLKAELMRRFAESVVARLAREYADSVEEHLDAIETKDATPYTAVEKLIDRFGSDRREDPMAPSVGRK
jgi:LAO/AO transport system kinase